MAVEAAQQVLRSAVWDGDAERVAAALATEPRLLSYEWNGRKLLSWGARGGHVSVVRVLLEKGADVNAHDGDRDTALHYAAREGHEEIVVLLLSHGADPSRRGDWGTTALIYASFRGHAAVVRLLLRYLGGHGLNERDGGGCTALFGACSRGHVDILRALLLAGADDAIADNQGRTPHQVATFPVAAAIRKWKVEFQRAYVLHKARTLHDGIATRQQAPAAPVPAYLSTRVQGGGVMPSVEVGAMQQDGQEGSAKRGRWDGAQDNKEKEVCAMMGFVVKDLAAELYIELLAGFRQ